MTELQLYRYINENNIEWHRQNNEEQIEDVCIMTHFSQLDEFVKLIEFMFSDDYLTVYIRSGYVCIWMKHICEHCDIEMENVFIGESNR